MSSSANGLLIAAPRSGSGKTVVSIALQRALRRRGLVVAGAKTGPDYIDPAFHGAATGRPSVNLDAYAMEPSMLAALAASAGQGADLIVAEGAMGLYDGVARGGATGASAEVARALGWPVLLVLDAAGAAQSLAATAHGFATYPGAPPIAGVIANRVASPRHGRMIAAGFAAIGVPLLGMIPTDPCMVLPSRHLGLIQATETPALDGAIDAMATLVAAHCDLDAIVAAARPTQAAIGSTIRWQPPGQRISIARDEAFTFVYPHLLEGWRAAGATVDFFSPLADEAPPEACDSCWLPGGYPELHAGRLAGNDRFLAGLRRFAATRPVHGECGGYMVLGETLTDAAGEPHAMAGLLPVDTSFAIRKLHLGYRQATWRAAVPFAAAGSVSIGHEYHHATIVRADGEPLADVVDGEGQPLPPAGSRAGQVTGTFFHLIR
jgi:cobyrinic acid a,c-diamide synthase